MQHVDEGTLHALLDGELPPEEAAQVRLHFATCPSCSARLDEARQLLAETERLVSALELPDAAPQAARPNAAPGSRAAAGTVAGVLVPPSPSTPLPPLDPVVLIPENPTSREVRRSRLRYMAWAATVVVAVGAGYVGMTQRSLMQARSSDARVDLSPDEFTTVQGTPARPDSAATLALTDSGVTPPPPRSALAKDTPVSAPAVPSKTETR
jgi:anti-sigma factor RsiW